MFNDESSLAYSSRVFARSGPFMAAAQVLNDTLGLGLVRKGSE